MATVPPMLVLVSGTDAAHFLSTWQPYVPSTAAKRRIVTAITPKGRQSRIMFDVTPQSPEDCERELNEFLFEVDRIFSSAGPTALEQQQAQVEAANLLTKHIMCLNNISSAGLKACAAFKQLNMKRYPQPGRSMYRGVLETDLSDPNFGILDLERLRSRCMTRIRRFKSRAASTHVTEL